MSAKQDKEILDTLRSSGLARMLKITQSKAAEMKSNFETQETPREFESRVGSPSVFQNYEQIEINSALRTRISKALATST